MTLCNRPLFPSTTCTIVILAALEGISLLGQSSTARNASDLHVRSAVYNPGTGTTLVGLLNNSHKAATAYEVDITMSRNGKVLELGRTGSDLLNAVLNERTESGSDDSWDGAIRPGDVYTMSVSGTDSSSSPAAVAIKAVVSGVIWSDGTVYAVDDRAKTTMGNWQSIREASARTEVKLISILDAHKADADIQRRTTAMLHDVTLLEQELKAEANIHGTSYALDELEAFEKNIDFVSSGIKSSTLPAGALDAYISMLVSRHSHRVALMQPLP